MLIPEKSKLEEITKELQKIMLIQHWDIELEYVDKYKMKDLFSANNFDTIMMCERYRLRNEATIYINSDHLALETQWYESIVHELYHVVTGGMSDITDDLLDEIGAAEIIRRHKRECNETTVVNLAKIFINVYPATNFIKDSESV